MQELRPPAFVGVDLRRPKGYAPPTPPPPAAASAPAQGEPCPRCESTNTKFCYYNNYNTSQPRHFCKGCRRYWTKGGTLRNVPVGGGSRKSSSKSKPPSKRRRVAPPDPAPNTAAAEAPEPAAAAEPAAASFTSMMESDTAGEIDAGFPDPGALEVKASDPNGFEWPALFDLGSYWGQSGFADADPSSLFLNLP